jgi:hypothetical protein
MHMPCASIKFFAFDYVDFYFVFQILQDTKLLIHNHVLIHAKIKEQWLLLFISFIDLCWLFNRLSMLVILVLYFT